MARGSQSQASKPVRLSRHARSQLEYRGATEEEVLTAIRSSEWQSAGLGRLECRMDIPYGHEWNGKMYGSKQVRPIFADEEDEIVVVTVYTYYF